MPKLPTGVSFWGAVGVVMTALHLKDRFDDYQRVSGDPESGRITLEDDEITLHSEPLLDTDLPRRSRVKREKSRHCCGCCGPKCGLFWKAFGIVFALFLGWQIIQLIVWSATPSPSGIEAMPSFKTSLACQDAPYLYKNAMVSYGVPIGSGNFDHAINIRGSAVGSVVLARGADDATEVKYEVTVRSAKEGDLTDIVVHAPAPDPTAPESFTSRFTLSTPYLAESGSCMNFDVTVYLPPSLKQLSIETHALAHIQFDQATQLDLDELAVTMFSADDNNMLLPNTGIRAKATTYELYNGWLVGEAYLLDELAINTHWGPAVTKLRVMPESSPHLASTAKLSTVGGSGRTDITYINNPSKAHRTIASTHFSSGGGETYVDYSGAQFDGTVDLTNARSWSASGLHGGDHLGDPSWVGSKEGSDRLSVNTRTWAKLDF